MCDFNREIFDPEFELRGAHLVEASAGTGKTYNIQNIFARLIMETDLRVSNILVVTFTEAATKELRERLHAVLADLKNRFDDKDCDGKDDDDVRKRNQRADSLIGIRKGDRETKRLRVELSLSEFDGAAVSTIHGFCQRALRRHAFETGIGFSQNITHDKRTELDVLAEDWWRTHKETLDREAGIKLGDLKKCIGKLACKADYKIDSDDVVLKIADGIVRKYEQGRLERENLNFDDLLRILRDTLKNEKTGAFAARLREEYKAALVDEFQDTDPVQYDIFKYVFLDDPSGGPLYFVGDPKQAIYAFRGGDIHTYFKAARGLTRHTLNVNHRSTRPLMAAVNTMFGEDKPGVTFGSDDIAYQPASVPAEASGDGTVPFRLVKFDRGPNTSAGSCMPEIIRLAVESIRSLLTKPAGGGGRVFSAKDIAILMNSKAHMSEMQQALLAAGIPSVIQDPGNVFSSSVAVELVSFLTAIAGAGAATGRRKMRAALLTVFGGVRAESAADELDNPNRFAEHIEELKIMKDAWFSHGFSALANHMERHGYLLRMAEKPDGERQLSDIGQIMELCCAATRSVGTLPENLINWLKTRISAAAANESDTEEYQRELETDGEAVRIMTIHASKGQQFPVVLLPDCWNVFSSHDPRNQLSSFFSYHDSNNELVFATSDKAREREAREELRLEKIRLLYVALTRAKERTVLIVPNRFTPEETKRKEPLIALLENMEGKNVCETDRGIGDDTKAAAAPADGGIGKTEALTVETPPDYHPVPIRGSYSSLSPGHGDDSGDNPRDCDEDRTLFGGKGDGDVDPIFAIPGGKRIGTCWHNILEKLAFDADDDAIGALVRAELAESGFFDDAVFEQTVMMVRKTLAARLTSPAGQDFTLREIPWEDRLSEQVFDFSTAGACASTAELGGILEKHWGRSDDKSKFLAAATRWSRVIPKSSMTGIVDLVFRRDGF